MADAVLPIEAAALKAADGSRMLDTLNSSVPWDRSMQAARGCLRKATAHASAVLVGVLLAGLDVVRAAELEPVPVEFQPLASNVERLRQALEFLGQPLRSEAASSIRAALTVRDAEDLQRALDTEVALQVSINPESRLRVERGPAPARLQKAGYMPLVVKIVNRSTVTKELRPVSPQSGPRYAGMTRLSAERMQRTHLLETAEAEAHVERFLDLEMYGLPPMTGAMSGLEVEYALLLAYASVAGKREAVVGFEIGQSTQDLGFRGETPVLFDIAPAVAVRLRLRDHDGSPAAASLVFSDGQGRVFPPQAKRLAPDLYFQPQIYRRDGDTVWLPPGRLTLTAWRGPEYRRTLQTVEVSRRQGREISARLERWIDPAAHGYYSGDHHIHGAGCAHYTKPSEGVTPEDMFLQVQGEGLNVGCVLTWGPCFDYQRQFFDPGVHRLSRPFQILKYDLEISGFGSEALGHVCLLGLRDQSYPGSAGTKTKGWPTWTAPVLRWAKDQGGVTGYAHSASGLEIHPVNAARRLLKAGDANQDGVLGRDESKAVFLPESFGAADGDRDGQITESELVTAHQRAAEQLPNRAVPEMNGVGAMEIPVTAFLGLCDFISTMNTPRIAEWNMWYHLLNCGLPLKASGETDFPCMSGERVGQGRVYVRMGSIRRLDFKAWCENLARGKSYVSDGFAHALEFGVNGISPGEGTVSLEKPGPVQVRARVAFAPHLPKAVAHGTLEVAGTRRFTGDTVTLHAARQRDWVDPSPREVELIVNGRAVAKKIVPADGALHELKWTVEIERSSWIALRQFPQLHTNPVEALVDGRPIRASRASARWCGEVIEQLWRTKHTRIAESERNEARLAYDRALAYYREVAAQGWNDDGE